MRAKQVYENIRFERGKTPGKAMEIGKYSHPYVELFEEMHEYCENDGFPGWQEVTPIEWNWKEPTFKAVSIPDKGLKWSQVKTYNFYLMEDKSGVGLDVAFTDVDGNPTENYYTITSFTHFTRLLESLHTRHIAFDRSGSMAESVNFQRGQDPKSAMEIGKAANPFVIEYAEREVDDEGYITGPLPEDHNQNTWFDSADHVEIQDVLENWKDLVDGSWYFHGYMKDNPEGEDGMEMFHAPEFNDEYVEYDGELYYIPDHKAYWDTLY